MRKFLKNSLKFFPFLITGILILLIALTGQGKSIDDIISYLPDNIMLAALIILVMYSIKGMSVIFPIVVLQIAAGLFFPIWIALILNIIGTALTYTFPYISGRIAGADMAEKLIRKYPKMREIIDFQRNSDWFVSFILRAVSCLPGDIVSMYLGSIRIPYVPYIIASVIGTLPGLIPATFVGENFLNPKSPEFIVSVLITIVASLISIILYYVIRKRSKQ